MKLVALLSPETIPAFSVRGSKRFGQAARDVVFRTVLVLVGLSRAGGHQVLSESHLGLLVHLTTPLLDPPKTAAAAPPLSPDVCRHRTV